MTPRIFIFSPLINLLVNPKYAMSGLPAGPYTVKNLNPVDGYLYGSAEKDNIVFENGHKFLVNWEEGQKTGFFGLFLQIPRIFQGFH